MSTAICCLEPVLAPYSIPRFRALQSLRRDCEVRIMALGAADWTQGRPPEEHDMGFRYAEAVPGEPVEKIEPRLLSERVLRWLDDSDPAAVVITGYYYPAMRAAARWARRHGRASIYMGDSQWVDRRRSLVREWAKGWWVRRHYDAAFAAGERAAAYLQRMGMPRERIWTGYDVVDNEAFAAGAVDKQKSGTSSSSGDSRRKKTCFGCSQPMPATGMERAAVPGGSCWSGGARRKSSYGATQRASAASSLPGFSRQRPYIGTTGWRPVWCCRA
jgi:1,2-diacylglycerol 3-alpha-glucosyltransferase